jgi:hypothetical protein
LRELRQASQAVKSSGAENKGTEQARGRLRTLRERVSAFGDGAERRKKKRISGNFESGAH